MNILLFGGTSEGRRLAQSLAEAGHRLTVCVATGYGAALVPDLPGVLVRPGRLDEAGMEALFGEGRFDCAVDATHPYAVEVTENLRRAAGRRGVPYYRLVRDGAPEGDWLRAGDAEEAARLAAGMEGGVLLTTGAKELCAFALPGLRERCVPRVLPSVASLSRCLELGFPAARILCMQGPFTRELNAALIRQYGIQVLVSKASGTAGGFWEKAEAARETGCRMIVIERPRQETGLSLEEIKEALR